MSDERTGAWVGLRTLEAADLAAVTALNDAEVPRVSPLGADGLAGLLPACDLATVAVTADGELAGVVLAMAPGRDYPSVNYRWFTARGTDFLYVDRIVVAPAHRGRGVADRLYDAVERRARATGRDEVTCEVNLRPPNPGSAAFHARRGFREVGRQDTTGGSITVALLARSLGTP